MPVAVSTTISCGPLSRAGAVDQAHALRLEQLGGSSRAGCASIDVHPLAQGVDVEGPFGLEAHGVGPGQLRELAAGRDHRLRRDAVPQVRGATDDVALDERDLGAERRRDRRHGVARRDHRR